MKRELSHKPHLWKRYGEWRCSSHNAAGSGNSPMDAFKSWEHAQRRFMQRQANRRKGLYRCPFPPGPLARVLESLPRGQP